MSWAPRTQRRQSRPPVFESPLLSHYAPSTRSLSASSRLADSPYLPATRDDSQPRPSVHLTQVHHPSLSQTTTDYGIPTLQELVSKYTQQVIRGVKSGSFALVKDHNWGPGQDGSLMAFDEMQNSLGRSAVANLALKAAKIELATRTEAQLDQIGLRASDRPLWTDSLPLGGAGHHHPPSPTTALPPLHHDLPSIRPATPVFDYAHESGLDSRRGDDNLPCSPNGAGETLFTSHDCSRFYASADRGSCATPGISSLPAALSDDLHPALGLFDGEPDQESSAQGTDARFSTSPPPLPPRTPSGVASRTRHGSVTQTSSPNVGTRSTANGEEATLRGKASKSDLARVKVDDVAKAKEAKVEKERAAKTDKELKKIRKKEEKLAKGSQTKVFRQAKSEHPAAHRAQTPSSSPSSSQTLAQKAIHKAAAASSSSKSVVTPPVLPTGYIPATLPILDVVPLPYLTFYVNRVPIKVLIDSGAMLNLIHPHLRDRLGLTMKSSPGQLAGVTGNGHCEGICEGLQGKGVELAARDPDRYSVSAATSTSPSTPSEWMVTRAKLVVGPAGGTADAILGMPWIVQAKAEITYHPGTGIWVSFDAEPPSPSTLLPSPSSSTTPLSPSTSAHSGAATASKVKRISLLAASESDLKQGYTWPSNYTSSTPSSSSRHQSSSSGATASFVRTSLDPPRRFAWLTRTPGSFITSPASQMKSLPTPSRLPATCTSLPSASVALHAESGPSTGSASSAAHFKSIPNLRSVASAEMTARLDELEKRLVALEMNGTVPYSSASPLLPRRRSSFSSSAGRLLSPSTLSLPATHSVMSARRWNPSTSSLSLSTSKMYSHQLVGREDASPGMREGSRRPTTTMSPTRMRSLSGSTRSFDLGSSSLGRGW